MDQSSCTNPAGLRARLLGRTEIAVGDRQIPDQAWPRRSMRSLLLLLLASPGRRLPRDQVLESLWPDSSPKTALNALYVAVHGLRRTLEPDLTTGKGSCYVDVSGDVVGLRQGSVAWIDVDEFESELAAATGTERGKHLAAALALYGGDLLADEPYLDWPIARREHLRRTWRNAALDYAELERESGRPLHAVPAIERVLQADPTDEPAYRALMTALAAAGRREDALRQFERCQIALADELGVEPGDEIRTLADAIRDAPATQPASVAAQSVLNTLPAPPNPLVGRGREVEALLDLVCQPSVRLATVTGTGGVGKTRLATEAASLAVDEFADGAAFVSLAAVRDPGLVVRSIAQAIGVPESPTEAPTVSLTAALQEREILLLLDNFEQVLDAAPDIAELIERCPRLTVLVTSREPLRIRAEHESPLAPLPVPEATRIVTAGGVARNPSVELFVQRASAVNPRFALTDANAPSVGALCARLDGLPLAIELAAARARHKTPDELVAGLSDRFSLLSGIFRDLPPRQRTMRAAIGWSYDLLDPAEQSLFRRLSVFSGGFTLNAAAAVAGSPNPETAHATAPLHRGGEGVGGEALSDMLDALTDKGLLLCWDDTSERRFFMLETIREFGKDELQASGELDAAERAHTRWFVELVERGQPEFTGPDQGEWFERLDTEMANLRAALQRLVDDPDATHELLRMSSALWRFWWNRGYAREGRSVLERALERPAGDVPHLRAKALHAAAEMADILTDHRQTEIWLNEALAIRRELGDNAGIAEVLNSLGHAARDQGALDRAEALHEEALSLLQPLDEPRATATTLNALGGVAYYRGDAERADALWRDTLARVRALNDPRSIVALLGNLGALAVMRQDPDQAIEYHEEALRIARQMGDVEGLTRTLINLAGATYERHDYEQARTFFEEALARSRQAEDTGAQAIILYGLSTVAVAQDLDGTAWLTESLSLFWRAGNLVGAAACLERVGMHARRRGQTIEALRLFAAAATIRDATGAARDTVDHGEYDEELSAARDALTPAEFDAIWSQGTHIEPDAAVAEAHAIASSWSQIQPITADPTTARSGSASPERFA